MVDTVTGRNLCDVERIDALKAADVVAVLFGIGTSLMVGMNAADRTKIVLGCVRVELVNLELLGAFDDMKPAERHGSHNGTSTTAIRTVAATRIDHPIREIQEQFHSTTVTGSSMLSMYGRTTNCFEAHFAAPKV
jgi:nicotinic acid phosphoribosyltransferase